jgi:hypothetical protein
MNIANPNPIPSPKRAVTDLQYETDLKAALAPAFSELLRMAQSAGWDRRRAAYAAMVLAAHELTENRGSPAPGGGAT